MCFTSNDLNLPAQFLTLYFAGPVLLLHRFLTTPARPPRSLMWRQPISCTRMCPFGWLLLEECTTFKYTGEPGVSRKRWRRNFQLKYPLANFSVLFSDYSCRWIKIVERVCRCPHGWAWKPPGDGTGRTIGQSPGMVSKRLPLTSIGTLTGQLSRWLS